MSSPISVSRMTFILPDRCANPSPRAQQKSRIEMRLRRKNDPDIFSPPSPQPTRGAVNVERVKEAPELFSPQIIIRAVPPIGANRAKDINAGEIFGRHRFMRDVRGDFDQLARLQDQLFAADLEMKRPADTVAELFAVMLMPRDDRALPDGQKRHRDFIAGKEATRKEIGDVFFWDFTQL